LYIGVCIDEVVLDTSRIIIVDRSLQERPLEDMGVRSIRRSIMRMIFGYLSIKSELSYDLLEALSFSFNY